VLSSTECYRLLKEVDITPVLEILADLKFVGSGDMAGASPSYVTIPSATLPDAVDHLVQSLGLGGSTHRRFFRRLEPGQGIPVHVDSWVPADANLRRFHLPIVSHPGIFMRWPDDHEQVYLMPGFLYEVRYDRLYEVVNRTTSERIHLQIDQIGATIGD
jgi:hypothetical protein